MQWSNERQLPDLAAREAVTAGGEEERRWPGASNVADQQRDAGSPSNWMERLMLDLRPR